jgi:hypothetical protein
MSAHAGGEIIHFCPPNAELRDENAPALVKAIVSLFDFLDATKELRADHGTACHCGPCTDLGGMAYTAELFLSCLQAQATRSPTITRREEQFLAR